MPAVRNPNICSNILINEHLSPGRTEPPFESLQQQPQLFMFAPDTAQFPHELSPRSEVFWKMLEQFSDDLFQTNAFQRIENIYVNPQFAVTARPNGAHPLTQLVGRMTRGAHVRDVVRIAMFDMKNRVEAGEDISGEEIYLTVFSSFAHDSMVSAFSHLSQDALEDKGIYIDHDLLLAFGMSQPWVDELLGRWGLDHKRAVVASLPISLLMQSPEERGDEWRSLQAQLEGLIAEDPSTWRKYQQRYGYRGIESIVDFDPNNESEKALLADPMLCRASQRAHELYDLAYGRTDHSQRELLELFGVSLLSHGELKTENMIGELERVNLTMLPQDLCNALAGTGRPPSGELYTCFVPKDAGTLHLALVELKGKEYIVRAIGEEELEEHLLPMLDRAELCQSLKRVKVPKANARYFELLNNLTPRGDNTWNCANSIMTEVNCFLSMGDFQSGRVSSPLASIGRAFFEAGCVAANGGKGVNVLDLIFGDHETCIAQWSPYHKSIHDEGYDRSYFRVFSLQPYSSQASRLWVGPKSPNPVSVKRLFERLSEVGGWLAETIGERGGEVIYAPSAPVSKKYVNYLDDAAREELIRRTGITGPRRNNESNWYYRRARSDSDRFSVGLKLTGGKTGGVVELHYSLHRGFEIAMHNKDRHLLTGEVFKELVSKIESCLSETSVYETGEKETLKPRRIALGKIFHATYFEPI